MSSQNLAIFPIKCGLYTDEHSSVPKNNEDHFCKDTDLDNLTIKCAEDYIEFMLEINQITHFGIKLLYSCQR